MAKLFRAAAEAETIHALGHLRPWAPSAPRRQPQGRRAGETYEYTEMYPPMLAQAQKDGHRAKVMFAMALKVEASTPTSTRRPCRRAQAGKDMEETRSMSARSAATWRSASPRRNAASAAFRRRSSPNSSPRQVMADTTAGSPWPEDAEGCDQLGLQWQGEQRYAEAAEAFARGLALAPDDFSLHLHYGNLWSEQCSFAPAEEQYRLALRLDPSSSTARNNLGYVLLKLGRLDEAEVLLREAVALAPELVLTLHNLIQVHRAQRDTRAVLDDAMQILRLCLG